MAQYRTTLYDRLGGRAPDALKASVWGAVVSLLAGAIVLLETASIFFALLATFGAFGFVVGGALLVSEAAGEAAAAALQHDGSGTPSVPDYSYEKALAIRGDVAGALLSYERHMAEQPLAATPRLMAADLYARQSDHLRAEALLRSVRGLATASQDDLMRASNRLIDLYLGPLDRPRDARIELRFLIEKFPGTQTAAHARTALARMRPGV